MVMLRIGDVIVSEQMFIGIQLKVATHSDGVSYTFEAAWNYGDRVITTDVHTLLIRPSDKPMDSGVMNAQFRIALHSIQWSSFSQNTQQEG